MELFAFAADYPFANAKNLEPLMGTSWFSVEKKPRHQPIEHQYKKYWVRISAHEEGIASYWDKDVLLFVFSQLIGGIKAGEQISKTIHFTGPDYFRFIGKKWSGKNDYLSLVNSLRRLQGTTIRTNVLDDQVSAEQGISWISEYRSFLSGNVTIFEVVLPEPFYKLVTNRRNWLTLDRSYFQIMGGVERFLYTWGRKSTGYKQHDTWEESFSSIYEKSGSLMPIRKFNYKLRGIIDKQTIPGYQLTEIDDVRRGPVLSLERNVFHPLLVSTEKIRRKRLPSVDPKNLKQLNFSLDRWL